MKIHLGWLLKAWGKFCLIVSEVEMPELPQQTVEERTEGLEKQECWSGYAT